MDRRGALALTVFVALIGSFVGLAVIGALEQVELHGVTSLHASGDRVYLAVGHEVVVTDPAGQFVDSLRGRDRRPFVFVEVTAIASDPRGGLLVMDAGAGRLLEFDSGGVFLRDRKLDFTPRYTAELLPLSDGRVVFAETMGRAVRIIDPEGRTLAKQAVTFPNGLTRLSPDTFAVVETGRRRVHAFDFDLQRIRAPELVGLERMLRDRQHDPAGPLRFRELLDLTGGPGAPLVASLCRTTGGECSLVRHQSGDSEPEIIADLTVFGARGDDLDDLLLLSSEVELLPTGAVLVASPRLSQVFVFEGPGGEPPAEFCSACDAPELSNLARAASSSGATGPVLLELDSLETATVWPNGTRIGVFGDDAVRARFDAQRGGRRLYARLQTFGYYGATGTLLLLLIVLFVRRHAGASASGGSLLESVWTELVLPDLRTYATVVLVISGAVVAGAAGGLQLLGPAGAIALALSCGWFSSRFLAAPLTLRLRSAAVAEVAWALQLGDRSPAPIQLEAGEALRWVTFARPAHRVRRVVSELHRSSRLEDLLEALELLAPRLALLARTDRRLFVVPCSLTGAPLGGVESFRVASESAGPTSTIRIETSAGTLDYRTGSSQCAALVASPGAVLCPNCREDWRSCAHKPGPVGLALALTLVLPGLGHLSQGRFRQARAYGLTGIAFALETFRHYYPQLIGTLPPNPWRYEAPLLAYGILVVVALADVFLRAWRIERRLRATEARTERIAA